MRDINRIKPLLEKIENIWRECPDLRLCQLIQNCFGNEDIYYKEDDVLDRRLSEIYGELLER